MSGLTEDLLRPENYPEPRPKAVRMVMTHGSWVFLTEDDAYKVKRPVDVGFFNFTTLESRRINCEAEVRINRRLAPHVYLGVQPVRKDGKGHSFVRGGEVVDYAVVMKRLPDSANAAFLVEHDLLRPSHLDEVARKLAAFYPTAPGKPEFATPEAIRYNVEENFSRVEPGRHVSPATFERVRSSHEAFLYLHAGRLRRRMAEGRIREGHGDLRLEHVYFLPSGPTIIDAIEFTERFRHLDPAADVAFLAMELAQRGRRELGEGFLGNFARLSNDYDLYSVVDFHMSYRAWVRGKIAVLLSDDPAVAPDLREKKRLEANALFDLSAQFCDPPSGPNPVIAVGGIIASGKSTIADALAARYGWAVVRSDETRKFLAGIPSLQKGDDAMYTPEFTLKTYDEVFRRAGAVLDSGRGIIIDATFRDRTSRLRARELARSRKRPFLFVEAWCDDETARERLYQRDLNTSVSDARLDLLDGFRKSFEAVRELGDEHLKADTTEPLEKNMEQVAGKLSL